MARHARDGGWRGNLIERGDVARSLSLLQQSLNLQDNPVTLRCIGLLQQSSQDAVTYYWLAWDLAVSAPYDRDPRHSSVLMFTLFIGEQMWDQAERLLAVKGNLERIPNWAVKAFVERHPPGVVLRSPC